MNRPFQNIEATCMFRRWARAQYFCHPTSKAFCKTCHESPHRTCLAVTGQRRCPKVANQGYRAVPIPFPDDTRPTYLRLRACQLSLWLQRWSCIDLTSCSASGKLLSLSARYGASSYESLAGTAESTESCNALPPIILERRHQTWSCISSILGSALSRGGAPFRNLMVPGHRSSGSRHWWGCACSLYCYNYYNSTTKGVLSDTMMSF